MLAVVIVGVFLGRANRGAIQNESVSIVLTCYDIVVIVELNVNGDLVPW